MDNIQEFLLNKLDKLDEKLDEIKEQNSHTKLALQAHEIKDDQIRDEVIKLSGQLHNQSKLLEDYNSSLKEHMRRTEMLENRQDSLDGRMLPIEKTMEEQKIVEKHKSVRSRKTILVFTIITTIISVIAAVLGLWFH